jgi:hypothetical protein
MGRIERSLDIIKSIQSEINYWIGQYAVRQCWTFDRCLRWRGEHVHDKQYHNLQNWAKERVNTFFDVIFDRVGFGQVVWTHVLDDVRRIAKSPLFDGRYQDIDSDESAHCHAFLTPSGQVILLPFRQKDRKREIKAGRITREDIQTCKKSQRLVPACKPNGSPVLALLCPVELSVTGEGYAVKHSVALTTGRE